MSITLNAHDYARLARLAASELRGAATQSGQTRTQRLLAQATAVGHSDAASTLLEVLAGRDAQHVIGAGVNRATDARIALREASSEGRVRAARAVADVQRIVAAHAADPQLSSRVSPAGWTLSDFRELADAAHRSLASRGGVAASAFDQFVAQLDPANRQVAMLAALASRDAQHRVGAAVNHAAEAQQALDPAAAAAALDRYAQVADLWAVRP